MIKKKNKKLQINVLKSSIISRKKYKEDFARLETKRMSS